MKSRISLRWRLILLSGSLAFGTALALTTLIHLRSQRHLLQQLEKTLEWKCDEVISVLERVGPFSALEEFFVIETNYRFSPYTYFYQLLDADWQILARSQNLGEVKLPVPEVWRSGNRGNAVHLQTESHPISSEGEPILLRSERLEVTMPGREPTAVAIQVAASLGPVESASQRTLQDAVFVAAAALAAVFFLLWFVTSRSLRPVAAMTSKAAQITAMNRRERLPLAGRGHELDELARVLNDMLDRLGASLRQMEQFSSGAAHQLRTPLTLIRGELDLVLRSGVSDPLRSQLEKIQEEVERLSRLCARLLLLARLDQQAADVSLLDERVELEGVVSELLEQTGPLAKDRGVQLRCSATSPVRIRGSRPLLIQALLNLLANAIRYSPEGGSVVISIEANADGVRVSVEDRGPGIPPEERERIFQAFYRIPRASTGPDDGSGLGLAIVRAIAQAHGGRVELTEAPGGGSVFSLVLPVHLVS